MPSRDRAVEHDPGLLSSARTETQADLHLNTGRALHAMTLKLQNDLECLE